MSVLKKSGRIVHVLMGKPSGGAGGVVKQFSMEVPTPDLDLTIANSGASGAKLIEEGYTVPVPSIATVDFDQTTPYDPDKVVWHDDSPPTDTDDTADALSKPTIEEEFNGSYDAAEQIDSSHWRSQTFTPASGYTVKGCAIMIYNGGGTITAGIYATDGSGHPTGAALCSGTILQSAINGSTEWTCIDFGAGYALSASVKYALVVFTNSATAGYWRSDSTSSYATGTAEWSNDAGLNWYSYSPGQMMFHIYSTGWGDVPAMPGVPAVGDGLYIGDASPFSIILVYQAKSGEGSWTITWKYYNTSAEWVAIPTFVATGNETGNWMYSGWRWIQFEIPLDWQVFSIDGSSLYWVKAEVTAYSSVTRIPVLSWIQVGDW